MKLFLTLLFNTSYCSLFDSVTNKNNYNFQKNIITNFTASSWQITERYIQSSNRSKVRLLTPSLSVLPGHRLDHGDINRPEMKQYTVDTLEAIGQTQLWNLALFSRTQQQKQEKISKVVDNSAGLGLIINNKMFKIRVFNNTPRKDAGRGEKLHQSRQCPGQPWRNRCKCQNLHWLSSSSLPIR